MVQPGRKFGQGMPMSSLVAMATIVVLAATSASIYADPRIADGSQLVNRTICEIEDLYSVHGMFTPFAKNPAYLEFGSVTDKTGAAYVVIVRHEGVDRCTWRISAALAVGAASADNAARKRHYERSVSFNCAAVDTPYRSDVGYFGVVDSDRRLEYVRPYKAWSVNVSSMTFAAIRTDRIYCPMFFGD
jgi:hypothetical protein